jgi:ABC-2 type transport system permease protein
MSFGPLLRAKARETRHGLACALRESTFKTVFLSLAYPGVALVAFGISYMGLRYLSAFPGVGGLLADRLVALLFFGASIMLFLSTVVVGLGLLYRSAESEFLLGLPIPPHAAYRVRALESVALSSWAFVLLGLPFAVAMAVAFRHAAVYVPAFAAVSGALAWASANAGLLVALLAGRWLVRGRAWLILIVGAALLAAILILAQRPEEMPAGPSALALVRTVLARTGWTRSAVFPSRWAAASLKAILSRDLVAACQWLAVLVVSSAVLWRVNLHVAHALYPAAWSAGQGASSRRARRTAVSATLGAALGWARPVGRALLNKDLLLWGRNPVFWGQTALFFGLLGLYFLNLRTLRYDELNLFWRTLVCVLNVAAVSLVTGALTTRFLYPAISMEGPRFWVLGLAPVNRGSILRHKLLLGLVWFLPTALGLGLLSSLMLRLPRFQFVWSLVVLALAVPTLCALAAGMGAAFPSRSHESTEKAVSGFGGTLTLALSLLYLLGLVAAGTMSLRLHMVWRSDWALFLLGAIVWSGVFSLGAMLAGTRRLSRMEF